MGPWSLILKNQSITLGTLSMFFAGRPWYHAFWTEILSTWSLILKKPILHVGYIMIERVLCRAPLIPCFFWMEILPTLFPIQKEVRAGISPIIGEMMENVTHNPVQVTEAWFMRSTCRCGALGEESRGVWVLRMQPKSIQHRLKGLRQAAATKKDLESLSNKFIPYKST